MFMENSLGIVMGAWLFSGVLKSIYTLLNFLYTRPHSELAVQLSIGNLIIILK